MTMILLTGGSGCGKSSFAESLCLTQDLPRYYIACMKPYGKESEKRIARHRKMREGKGFTTYECYEDVADLVLPEKGVVLLECICNLCANELFDNQGVMQDPVLIYESVLKGVRSLERQSNYLVIVTNDVGSERGDYALETMEYLYLMGRINQALAKESDEVYELVCGIPLALKGGKDGE